MKIKCAVSHGQIIHPTTFLNHLKPANKDWLKMFAAKSGWLKKMNLPLTSRTTNQTRCRTLWRQGLSWQAHPQTLCCPRKQMPTLHCKQWNECWNHYTAGWPSWPGICNLLSDKTIVKEKPLIFKMEENVYAKGKVIPPVVNLPAKVSYPELGIVNNPEETECHNKTWF